MTVNQKFSKLTKDFPLRQNSKTCQSNS